MGSKGFFGVTLLLLILSVSTADALEKNEGKTDLWRVCLLGLDGKKLSSEYTYLVDSIPFSLQNTLEDIKEHNLSDTEKIRWLEKERDKVTAKTEKELSALYKKRDLLFFSGNGGDKERIASEITAKKEELNRIKGQLAYLPPDFLDINVTFEDRSIPFDEIRNLKGCDQTVYGTLETIDRWLFLSIRVYNHVTGKDNEVFADLMDPEDISKAVETVSLKIAGVVSGKNPPVLVVSGTPADAFFNLNGGENYLSGYPVRDFTSGNYSLTVHKQGYKDEKKIINLEEGKRTEVEYSLERKNSGFAVINTVPSGADLYLDSVWMGRSPLILEDPVFPSYLKVEKEGYLGEGCMLEDKSGNRNFSIDLTSIDVNKDLIRENRRKTFYNSLGLFIVSLAVPVVSYGISSDYGYAYNSSIDSYSTSGTESDRLMSISNTWYSIYLGGIFVSTSLFIDMAIKLGSYISFY